MFGEKERNGWMFSLTLRAPVTVLHVSSKDTAQPHLGIKSELQKPELQEGKEVIPQDWILIVLSELLDIRSHSKRQQDFE